MDNLVACSYVAEGNSQWAIDVRPKSTAPFKQRQAELAQLKTQCAMPARDLSRPTARALPAQRRQARLEVQKASELPRTSPIEPLKKGGGQLRECSHLSQLSDGPQLARALTVGCSLLEL